MASFMLALFVASSGLTASLAQDPFYDLPYVDEPAELLQQSYQFRLLNDILSEEVYDPRVRPVRDVRLPVQVTFKLMLYQIIDVVEPEQTIILNCWVSQYWVDEFLGWLPVAYGDITQIMLPEEHVWTPDTYLYNSLEMSAEITEHRMSVVVDTDASIAHRPQARISMMYPAIYKFSCSLHVQYFPFDRQRCRLSFGSWTFDIMFVTGINYTTHAATVSMEEFKQSQEWQVIAFVWNRTETTYACCPHPYVMLHAELVIQRKPLFHIVNLILPSAIIALVSVWGFFLPTTTTGERSEKVNLGITTLLAMAILLLMVVDQMPPTSEFVPLMGVFYLVVMGIISVGTLLTSAIICLQRNGEYGLPVPWYWHWLTVVGGTLLMVPLKKQLQRYFKQKREANRANKKNKKNNAPPRTIHNGEMNIDEVTLIGRHQQQPQQPAAVAVDNIALTACMCQHREEEQPVDEQVGLLLHWEHVAEVIDRFLLIMFTTQIVLVTVGIMAVGSVVMEEGLPPEEKVLFNDTFV